MIGLVSGKNGLYFYETFKLPWKGGHECKESQGPWLGLSLSKVESLWKQ